ncbi:8-amino-7-oxononanoate synthase [Akkermansiaceae bacterium]|nr:8-amino-7-oxononanoate synthase [Akkermansiaceae bacterium]MDB4465513.1 8-amino-7-oxononanoate synthase [Akkermansiaceae bacterium]
MSKPEDELGKLEQRGLLRRLRQISNPHLPTVEFEGRKLINFSSNDYLGLAQHPALIEAATKALRDYGTGSTASRLICGSLDLFHQLEEKIAKLKKAEAALTFANGYSTAMGSIPAIVGKGDTIILDKLAHACLIDAAKLSGATLRIFPHNDLNKLKKLLISSKGRTLIISESVFSMDGDLCPLKEIVSLKKDYGALLFLDEAHGVGIFGDTGQGLAEELDLQGQIDFQMGTLGKALGSAGGYLATSQAWHDLLINKARSLIYSTAPPPSQAAASLAALTILGSPEGQKLRERLQENISAFESRIPNLKSHPPIIPRVLGENSAALAASASLLKEGFLVPAIRYPTVPRETARLRITLSAAHSPENIQHLKEALASL